jgi:hypothetical protein
MSIKLIYLDFLAGETSQACSLSKVSEQNTLSNRSPGDLALFAHRPLLTYLDSATDPVALWLDQACSQAYDRKNR